MGDAPLYIAACSKCRALIVMISGDVSFRKEASKEVARAIRDGYSVTQKTAEEANAMQFGHSLDCPMNKSGRAPLKEAHA